MLYSRLHLTYEKAWDDLNHLDFPILNSSVPDAPVIPLLHWFLLPSAKVDML